MSNYNREWERTKQYLIRGLFQSETNAGLSPILEESTYTSTTHSRNISPNDRYSPSEETVISSSSSITLVERQPEIRYYDLPERSGSPLPPLIIEREPNKHDESDEYYDQLLIRMKKVCRKLYIEGRSLSDDDFFIDSDQDFNVDTNIYEQNELSNGRSSTRIPEGTNYATFDVDEEMNDAEQESNDDNEATANQIDTNINKPCNVRKHSNFSLLTEDTEPETSRKDSSSTDLEDSQSTATSEQHFVNVKEGSQEIPSVAIGVDNTSPVIYHSRSEGQSSPSAVLSTLNSPVKEPLEQTSSRQYGMLSTQNELAQSPQDFSFDSQISSRRDRSPSPILVCPYTPLKRSKKAIDSIAHQESEDVDSPQLTQKKVRAVVHVDDALHSENNLPVEVNRELQIKAYPQLVPYSSSEYSTRSSLFDETLEQTLARACGLLPDQVVTSPQEFTVSRQTAAGQQYSWSPILPSQFEPHNPRPHIIDSTARIYEEDTANPELSRMIVQPVSRMDTELHLQDTVLVKYEIDLQMPSAVQPSILTTFSSDSISCPVQAHERTQALATTRMIIDPTPHEFSIDTQNSVSNSNSPQPTQMTVQAMVHVDAELQAEDRQVQDNETSLFVQDLLPRESAIATGNISELSTQELQELLSDIQTSVGRQRSESTILVYKYKRHKSEKDTITDLMTTQECSNKSKESIEDETTSEDDSETKMRSLVYSASDEDENGISDRNQDSGSSLSTPSEDHVEEMRSVQPHTSIESFQMDKTKLTSDMDITPALDGNVIAQDITNESFSRQPSQEPAHNKSNNTDPNTGDSDPGNRKRRHEDNSSDNNRIDWDALGNIFVGKPKLFKLCPYTNSFCNK